MLSFRNMKISFFALVDKRSRVSFKAKINHLAKLKNTEVGDYSYIGPKCDLWNVKIGKFCSISSNVTIGLATHPIDFISTSPIFFNPHNGTGTKWVDKKYYDDQPKETLIGNDVWIGMDVIIMSGVKIGDGAVIAAGSIVTKDVNKFGIYAGVPAKLIKKRFTDEIIEKLETLRWWDLPDNEIQNIKTFFTKTINIEAINDLIKTKVQK
jgi:acetyltransferase-like isoleucine patch superfamily enzyme